MTFSKLYETVARQKSAPLLLEGLIDAEVIRLTAQDQILYAPVELDTEISLGHIKQYRQSGGVYDQDPQWITEIRYSNRLNMCWRRFVCCKELMHVFDTPAERVDSAVKFDKLLEELAFSPLNKDASPMYISENKTKWMALAILCPLPFREFYKPLWDCQEMSDYDVALELRIPEVLIKAVMTDYFGKMISSLTEQNA